MKLRDKVISSVRWMAVTKIAGQLVSWSITIFVIRILSPDDYGVMALAMLPIGFCAILEEVGLGAALVQQDEIERQQISQVFGLSIGVNCGLFLLLLAMSPLIADFFEEPRLGAIIPFLGLRIPLISFAVIPDAILIRRMDFRGRSTVDLATVIIGGLVTLGLAIIGYGVWSLVIGNFGMAVVRVIMLNLMVRYWCPPKFSMTGIRELVKFASFVTMDRILWYFYSIADVIIIGKVLGNELLGVYSVAKDLASLPMRKVPVILNEVGFAAFSRIQNDKALVSANLKKAARLLGFVAFPLFFGISSVAPELVDVLLGEKWALVLVPLQLLSLVLPLQMLGIVITPALLGIGRPDIGLGNVAIGCIIMPVSFLIGIQWGLVGVSVAWLVATPLRFAILLYRSLPVLGVKVVDYVRAMRSPAAAAGIMYAAVFGMRELVTQPMLPPVLDLICLILTGVFVYAVAIFTLQRDYCREVLDLIKR